ncbi:MAG: hypothetical protein NT129_00365 [Candidatus Aenigmarchaeota archaeon]|nr:hypothetical protein [Candidatus Aenigmarchaeota archaeon]
MKRKKACPFPNLLKQVKAKPSKQSLKTLSKELHSSLDHEPGEWKSCSVCVEKDKKYTEMHGKWVARMDEKIIKSQRKKK